MFEMKKHGRRNLVIVASMAALIVLTFVILDSGWVIAPKWHTKSERYQAKSLRTALAGIAGGYERAGTLPSKDIPQVLSEDTQRWGFPVQYSYEDDTPTLRAAGADGKLSTDDDILQRVNITK